MKWLVLALLVVNGIVWYASDDWVPGRVRMVATDQTLPRVSTLKVSPGDSGASRSPDPVVEEAREVSSPSVSASQPQLLSPDSAPEPVERFCVRLGWFETAEGARNAYQSIGGPGNLQAVREQERALEPLHWVIIPPQPEDRALALFNDLQRRGIDSYLVTRGENTNAISLGLFQFRDAAERVLEAKKRQNLNAILANFPRNQISYALVFEVTSAAGMGDEDGRINDYREDFEMVEISGCEGIATTPENP